jgi:flagellar motor switch protein FliM
MESTWTRADFKNLGQLQGASAELLRSTQEVLGKELGLSLSAFLRNSVTAAFKEMAERPFGDLQKAEENKSCLASALVRPDDRRLLVELDYSVLFPLIGIALGAKTGSFTAPQRKPTDLELQVVSILFRLILSEAFRAWVPLINTQLETVTVEIERTPSRAFQSTDSLLVIRFDVTVGEQSGQLSLIVPPELFRSAVQAEEAPPREKRESSASVEATIQLMLPAQVTVDVWLDGAQMRLRDLLQLREGQIVKLDHPVEKRAVCTLNGTAGFSGQIVSTGARRAFMVEEASGAQS